jgi:hypothetical protein
VSEQPIPSGVRPYAVYDALNPDQQPRVIIEQSPSGAVAHVVRGRFTAEALHSMDVLRLQALGVDIEDPRKTLPQPQVELPLAAPSGAPLPSDLGPCPPAACGQIQPEATDAVSP